MALYFEKDLRFACDLGIRTMSYCEGRLSEVGQSWNPDVGGSGSYCRRQGTKVADFLQS